MHPNLALALVGLLSSQAPDSRHATTQPTTQAIVPIAAQNPPSTLVKWAFGVSLGALAISAMTGYFQFRAHRAKKPVISVSLDNLPPYDDPQDRTYVLIKNVGSGATTRRLTVTVSCSWMPLVSYRLNLPNEEYCLEPNEEYWWRISLNDQLVPNSVLKVTVWDAHRDHWEAYEHLNTPTIVAPASEPPTAAVP